MVYLYVFDISFIFFLNLSGDLSKVLRIFLVTHQNDKWGHSNHPLIYKQIFFGTLAFTEFDLHAGHLFS